MEAYKVQGMGGVEAVLLIISEKNDEYDVIVRTSFKNHVNETQEQISRIFIEEGLKSGNLIHCSEV